MFARRSVITHIVAIATSLVISACSTSAPALYGGPGSNSILHNDSNYKLAAIEFGEFGSYSDPTFSELSRAVNLIDATPRPLVVAYFHGWHNDITSGDVERFSNFLSRLVRAREVITNRLNVVGVYFAWPGESLRIPIVNTFTFWNRKIAAERIANNADCLDAIEKISEAARRHSANYVFLMGHSFGGLILERAVAHTMRTLQGKTNVRPPWDLALMLNPASDSVLARELVSGLDGLYTYKSGIGFVPNLGGPTIPENQPTIVELQADNDQATGLTFPIGTGLGAFLDGHWAWNRVGIPGASSEARLGPVSEKKFYLATPGNNRYLVNYAIVEIPKRAPSTKLDAFDFNLRNNPIDRVFWTSAPKNSESAATAVGKGAGPPDEAKSEWRAWQIRYAGDVNPSQYGGNARVPFWIVRVPSQIIDNHGGIWSDNNMALMGAIFRLHRPIVTRQITVGGRKTAERVIPAPAKSYVLPSAPPSPRY
jgi:hypothetical protein